MREITPDEYSSGKERRLEVPKLVIGRICLFVCASRAATRRWEIPVTVCGREGGHIQQLLISQDGGMTTQLYEFGHDSLWKGKDYLGVEGVRMTQGYLKDRRKEARMPGELGIVSEIPDSPEELVKVVGSYVAV
jgi:hypothetical protein